MRTDNHPPYGSHFNLEKFSHNYWEGGRNKIKKIFIRFIAGLKHGLERSNL